MVLATAALSALALTACSGDPTTDPSGGNTDDAATTPAASPSDSSSSPDPLPTESIIPSENLDAITVSDADVPEITVPAPWAISSTQTKVLRDSSNPQVVGEKARVTVNYVGVNGRTGAVFDSSFQRGKEATFSMGGVIAGFKNGLTGQKVGSRVLIDTPGVRALAATSDSSAIDETFDDVSSYAAACRYSDCSHSSEPGCAVQQALADGTLDPERFERYRRMMAESARLRLRSQEREYRQSNRAFTKANKAGRRTLMSIKGRAN